MKHIIIGTAGHIDHGKTTLIRALTGRNTDRLQEEIRRGISIDLGFTYFDLPSGRRAGIIDVPGHERFIKNMIAGAGGIDIVLLVVAATEGVMPQTREHADIVRFLGIKEGLIVMTQCGNADELMRELAADDIREQFKGTFFEDKEIVIVDSLNGYGLETLVEKIDTLTAKTQPRDMDAPPRLPIDRVFTIKGYGTVVTGTLVEGSIRINDELTAYTGHSDEAFPVRIKNIQVHETNVTAAYAGQRTALNLSGIKASDLTRGDTLAAEGSVVRTALLDARVTLTPRTSVTLKMWDRLRVYLGAREVFARFVPFGDSNNNDANNNHEKDSMNLTPGASAFCQLRFEQAVYIKKGDPFVIRRYSPMETIGGGVVVDPAPVKRRRADTDALEDLSTRMEGTETEVVERCLRGARGMTDMQTLCMLTAYDNARIEKAMASLINDRVVYKINQDYLHLDTLENYRHKLLETTARFHNENPLTPGMAKEALRTKTALPLKIKEYDALLALLAAEGSLKMQDGLAALPSFSPRYDERQQQIHNRIEKIYLEAGFTPPPKSQTAPDKASRLVFDSMVKQTLIPLDEETFLHTRHMETAKAMIYAHCKEHQKLTLAEFRDMTGSSRKYCLLILEYLDHRRFTQRDGDSRILNRNHAPGT